jgi:hypothetical protein
MTHLRDTRTTEKPMLTQDPVRPAAKAESKATALAMAMRLAGAKRAYTTRHVPMEDLAGLLAGPDVAPRAGDLVLARVQRVGKHAALELAHSRRATMFVGDEVLVAYAARYAPDQFLAEVPCDLGPCHLAASGGDRHGGGRHPGAGGAVLEQRCHLQYGRHRSSGTGVGEQQGEVLDGVERNAQAHDLSTHPGALKRVGGAVVDPAHQGGGGINGSAHGRVLSRRGISNGVESGWCELS